jgi:hypothetical protein
MADQGVNLLEYTRNLKDAVLEKSELSLRAYEESHRISWD